MEDQEQIQAEISKHMPFAEFLRIFNRIDELKHEEEAKLKALGDLQKMYVSANSDEQREAVKQMVVQIRELSRQHRQEIRALNDEIQKAMPFAQAQDLYKRWVSASAS